MAMLLRVAYDGTEFRGFARQNHGQGPLRTVQGTLETALSKLYKQPLRVRGASRTDAGVHARGQLIAFDPPFEIPTRGVLLGLAGLLPEDLIACAAWFAEDVDDRPLDPRFHNLGKLYRYRLRPTNLRDPISARNEWHLPRPIDLDAIKAAAPLLAGTHDFAGFRASDCQARTTVRRVRSVELRIRPLGERDPLAGKRGHIDDPDAPGLVEFDVRGDAFLKNMVRIMVGTLVGVGRGQFGAERIPEVLRSGQRERAGITAPACGLTLVEVLWPEPWPPASPRSPR